MQPLSGNHCPDLLTALMKMSFVLRLPRKIHLCRSSNAPRMPSFLERMQTLTFCSLLRRCTIPCACHAKAHLNLQEWREHDVFCTFWLRNVLRATTASTFSTSQLPKVVRTWCVLYILTWTCASRHNSVQFFISHLASWLRTRRFSEPTFRPSGATNHWKNKVFRDFHTFSRICIFFLLTLSLLLFSLLIFLFSLTLSISAFHLSMLSEVWLLNFLRLTHQIYCFLFHLVPMWATSKTLPQNGILWVKQCHKPSPSHHFYRWYKLTIPSHGWFMASFYPHYFWMIIPENP